MRRLLACLLLAAAWPAAADPTIIAGRPAQALRCAAYIGMAAQYGHAEGIVSTADRNRMTLWSVMVLERWVPLTPAVRLDAYGEALAELDTRSQTTALIARHAGWCIDTFRPLL
jgi:hypothetical protein